MSETGRCLICFVKNGKEEEKGEISERLDDERLGDAVVPECKSLLSKPLKCVSFSFTYATSISLHSFPSSPSESAWEFQASCFVSALRCRYKAYMLSDDPDAPRLFKQTLACVRNMQFQINIFALGTSCIIYLKLPICDFVYCWAWLYELLHLTHIVNF